MSEWVRGPAWASPAARATWAPRIEAFGEAWAAAEIASVVAGVRPSCLLVQSPARVAELSAIVAGQGLGVAVLSSSPLSSSYSGATPSSGPAGLRVAVTRGPVHTWHEAWTAQDDRAIGELLGFPECCREFFGRTWGAGLKDTTWPQAGGGEAPASLEVHGPPEASVLLRWIGVRLVPHLPCSFGCEYSAELGRRMAALLPEDVARHALELLDSPTSWSSVHGAAEVVVDGCLRFDASTDPSKGARYVTRPGRGTPPELDPAAETVPSHTDNGFGSEARMLASHQVLGAAVRNLTKDGATVLDLGCGDGALVNRFAWASRRVGVERDPARAERGEDRHPAVELSTGRLENVRASEAFDLALLMPGRLLELPPQTAAAFRYRMPKIARRWLAYTYDATALEELVARAGLELVERVTIADRVQFAVLKNPEVRT